MQKRAWRGKRGLGKLVLGCYAQEEWLKVRKSSEEKEDESIIIQVVASWEVSKGRCLTLGP